MTDDLHPLHDFPGVVIVLDEHDRITDRNARARELLDAQRFSDALDAASRSKWKTLTADSHAFTTELLLAADLQTGPRRFYVSPRSEGRRTVIETSQNDAGLARIHEELNALNSDLITAQRESARNRAELQRAYDEKYRLSTDLQAHGEELEAQNEELLAITEELRLQQEESRRLNDQLEEKAGELRRVLNSRDRFFSAMSHELRTPLTAVLGYSHLLIDGVGGTLDEKQKQFIERIRTAAQHLNSLLDDILDMAKLESGTLELTLEQVMIDTLMTELRATIGPAADAAGSEIRIETGAAPDFITADARALRQILLNLLSNAVKFGEAKPITLSCTRRGARVTFRVADQGVGVPPGEAEQIFEEFSQGEAGRQRKGTGLGLWISRQLAERMGGRLWVEAGQPEGSVFVLELPVAGPVNA